MEISPALIQELTHWYRVSLHCSMPSFMAFMRQSGLSLPQLIVLQHLQYCQECTISDIAEHLGVSNPAASQLVDRLFQMNLVERREGREDRRMKNVFLTETGTQIVQGAIHKRWQWIERLDLNMSIAQQEQLVDLLAMLRREAEKA